MPEPVPNDVFRLQIITWICVAVFCAAVASGTYFYLARQGRSLLPPLRFRAVPWKGMEVFATIFITLFLWLALCQILVVDTNFLPWLYGPDFPITKATTDLSKVPKQALFRLELWVQIFAFPFQILTIPLLLNRASGTRPYQLGLTCNRFVENAACACLAWLLVTPLVYAVDYGVEWFYRSALDGLPEQHPIFQFANDQPLAWEAALMVFFVLIAAPVLEELIFRGVLMRWLMVNPWGGNAVIIAALGLAFVYGQRTNETTRGALGPMIFVVAMIPGYLFVEHAAWRWLPQPNVARAIYSSALLFAASHSAVWPSPIPLFVLALALGYLAYRTQSLVAPIFLHGLFNSVSCYIFFTPQGA